MFCNTVQSLRNGGGGGWGGVGVGVDGGVC